MDIVVKGRNVEVPDHYREHVAQKLAPSERLDSRLIRFDVELMHEKNPRQSDRCQRVEITCYSKGPVIRAEAIQQRDTAEGAFGAPRDRLDAHRLVEEVIERAAIDREQLGAGNDAQGFGDAVRAYAADANHSTIQRDGGRSHRVTLPLRYPCRPTTPEGLTQSRRSEGRNQGGLWTSARSGKSRARPRTRAPERKSPARECGRGFVS